MSIHVCQCQHNGRTEHHLRYPGMSQSAAQELADKINGGRLQPITAQRHIQAIKDRCGSVLLALHCDKALEALGCQTAPQQDQSFITCSRCGNDLDDEESGSPDKDEDGDIICSNCWSDLYQGHCGRCGEYAMQTELKAHPGELIAVWENTPATPNDLTPGYYRVKQWPFFSDGMIEGHMYANALSRFSDLDELGKRASGEQSTLCSPLCQDCRTKIEKYPPPPVITCVYCGHQYPAGTPSSGADSAALTEHIKACEKHPMRQLEADKAALLDAIAEADDCREILGNLIDNIKSHGHYSAEATLVFLDQARSSLNPLQCAVETTRSN